MVTRVQSSLEPLGSFKYLFEQGLGKSRHP
jgi:hypothetical protein